MTAVLCRQLGRAAPLRHGLALRGIARESYGRRPELYDDDVFVPIDEAPAVSRRKVATRSVLKLNLSMEKFQDENEKEENEKLKDEEFKERLEENEKLKEQKAEQERPLKFEEKPKLEAKLERTERPGEPSSPSKVLGARAVRPPPPPPSLPQKPGLRAPPVAPQMAPPVPPEQVEQFLQQHGITLEGTGDLRPLRPIRSFEEGGFPEQVACCS
eukprot:Skav224489  [mRNA]  locus=scaffold1294:15040:15681:+ [translate_table: standard]